MTPRALPASRGQPDPDRRGLALSRQRGIQPGCRASSTAKPWCSHGSRIAEASPISPSRARPTASGGWSIDPEPLLAPADGVESEQWGFEDPRIVWVDELDRWVITCTAYGPAGPAVYLATTTDFRSVERLGII